VCAAELAAAWVALEAAGKAGDFARAAGHMDDLERRFGALTVDIGAA